MPRLPHRFSQGAKILQLLSDGEWHTTREILREVPCIVHSRVSELRRSYGWNIEHDRAGPGASGSRYRLLDSPPVWPGGESSGPVSPSAAELTAHAAADPLHPGPLRTTDPGGGVSAVHEKELARLIAEQEADDTYRVWQRDLSLDASPPFDSGSFHEVVGDEDERLRELLGENETWMALVKQKRVTDEDVKYWRYLRTRLGWSNVRIAQECGVSSTTVWAHLGKPTRRVTEWGQILNEKLSFAKAAYARGARLIDVAEAVYEQAGYKSPESCYQALRRLFLDRRVPIRPRAWKHGKRSKLATRETYIAYWREQNWKARDRRRSRLRPCVGITRSGDRCSRSAIGGSPFCVTHSGYGRKRTWTFEAVDDAICKWADAQGRPPRTSDWRHATLEHPNFKTVYNLYRVGWNEAIQQALARERQAA